jgi:HlyD family secretion protein
MTDLSHSLMAQPLHTTSLLPRIETRSVVRAGLISLGLLAGCFGFAMWVPINGAVVASGQILVEGKPQPVQSLEPGIVSEVTVKNGDHVEAGAVILALDSTLLRTKLDAAREQLGNALAETDRLTAEADGLAQPRFSAPALPFAAPDLTAAAARQTALFDTRRAQRSEAKKRLIETDAQLAAQIEGLDAQIKAAEEQAAILNEDLQRQTALVNDGLARRQPLLDLMRQQAELAGRTASLRADRLRIGGARREAVLTLSQDESRRDEEVAQGLRDISAKSQELISEILSLQDQLARSVLRAPVTGIVHELQVPAPGSVIAAGAVLAQIVPTNRAMEIEVMVDPRNIESVHQGQSGKVMLSAYDPRMVPKLAATVINVPPGAVTDPQTGRSFYRVTLHLDGTVLPEGVDLRPGMPVQAFLSTGERPLLNWLLSPVMAPLSRAMRES